MPKPLAKIYLKFIGRKPDFIEHINYVTSHSLVKELEKYDVDIRNLTVEQIRRSNKKRNLISKNLS